MTITAKKYDIDMTTGNIWRHLLMFALPLMVGNVFQVLYNTVDSIVVGNYVGTQALAAVGSTGPIINTMVGFFNGFAVGVGVIISQYYGARNDDGVHRAVHTSVLSVLIMSVFFTALGIYCVKPMLRMMSTPDDVFAQAQEYLTIYFAGLPGLMLYNIGAGILRAVGDSRRPLYFLVFCVLANTGLDVLFVVKFHWGIAGVAYATIIAQALSSVLVFWVLMRSNGCAYQLFWRKLALDKTILRQVLIVGLPTAIQQAVTSFSNIFVQSYINRFGSSCMAGWSSYGKIDQFALLPMTSISAAATTFVGQNLGCGNLNRAKKGVNRSLVLSIASVLILMVPLILWAPQLIALFDPTPDVVRFGTLFIRLITPFYVLPCFNQAYAGALRGAGDSRAPMLIMLGSFVLFRQIYLYNVSRLTTEIIPIALGYPIGWFLCSALLALYYYFSHWEERSHLIAN